MPKIQKLYWELWADKKLFDKEEINNFEQLILIYDKLSNFKSDKNSTETEEHIKEENSAINIELLNRFWKDEKDLSLNTTWKELKELIRVSWKANSRIEQDEKKERKVDLSSSDSLWIATNKFLRSIIDTAIERKASDIHIEPKFYSEKWEIKWYWRVRMRENWDLVDKLSLSFKFEEISFNTIMNWLATLSWENLDKAWDKPLDFKIDYTYRFENEWKEDFKNIDLRCATLPVEKKNCNIVIRLLWNFKIPKIWDIWLRESQFKSFKIAIGSSDWIIIVTWPTWSWKSTTQSSILKELSLDPTIKIITWENPIENRDNLIVQSPIVTQSNKEETKDWVYDNKKFLKSCLRSDPNVIVIQEIRDLEEANIAVEAALTWHLVLSTFHANTSALTVTRLEAMWMQKILLSSSLKMILSQRLVKKPCTCHNKRKLNENEINNITKIFKGNEELLKEEWLSLEWIENDDGFVEINKEWCIKCNHTWVIWRQWIFELMLFNKDLLEELSKEDSTYITIEKFAKKVNWMADLSQDALIRVLKKEVDYNDANKALNFDLI